MPCGPLTGFCCSQQGRLTRGARVRMHCRASSGRPQGISLSAWAPGLCHVTEPPWMDAHVLQGGCGGREDVWEGRGAVLLSHGRRWERSQGYGRKVPDPQWIRYHQVGWSLSVVKKPYHNACLAAQRAENASLVSLINAWFVQSMFGWLLRGRQEEDDRR